MGFCFWKYTVGLAVVTLTTHGAWAWSIMAGYARTENRCWSVSFQGPIWT